MRLVTPNRDSVSMFDTVDDIRESLVDSHHYGAYACGWSAHPGELFILLETANLEHELLIHEAQVAQVLTRRGTCWTWMRNLADA